MASFGFFRIKIPFTATDLLLPLPVSSGAMINDGTPYPGFEGPTAVTRFSISPDNTSFRLVGLFQGIPNASGGMDIGPLLPNNVSGPYEQGGWSGFFLVQRVNMVNDNFALECFSLMPGENVGGNSQPCMVSAPAPPPPPPGVGHRVVIRTELAKVADNGVLAWDGADGSVHKVTVTTGPAPTLEVDGAPVPWPT